MNARSDRVAEIRDQARALEGWLALWAVRDDTAAWETTPAAARTAGGEAVTAIDNVLRALHQLRSELVTEIRQFDDESAASTDALLERLRREKGITPLPDDQGWTDTGSGPGYEDPRD